MFKEKYHYLILTVGIIAIAWIFSGYITGTSFETWDLEPHIRLVHKYAQQIKSGNLTFYDPEWFSGWPAFQFYGFFGHLLSALICILLTALGVTAAPAALAVTFLTILQLSLLPFWIYFLAEPLRNSASRNILATVSVLLAFWLLSSEYSAFGIGAQAFLSIGLFSQLCGLTALFFAFGSLVRIVTKPSSQHIVLLVVSGAILHLTHLLTAVYFDFCLLATILLFQNSRRETGMALLFMVGLSAFWLFPAVYLAAEYLPQDIFKYTGDLFSFIFRYSPRDLTAYLSTPGILSFSLFNLILSLILIASLLAAFFNPRLRGNQILIKLAIVLLLAALVFGSVYTARTLQLSFHYYRFLAYTVYLVVALLSLPLTELFSTGRIFRSAKPLAACLVFFCLQQGYELRLNAQAIPVNEAHLTQEKAILKFLQVNPYPGRIYFEHLAENQELKSRSPHYLSSRVMEAAGIETINGVFIQSALAHRFPSASVNALRLSAYSVPPIFDYGKKFSVSSIVDQLSFFNISQLVVGSRDAKLRLEELGLQPVFNAGILSVYRLNPGQPAIATPGKPLIAYCDHAGTLPFKYLEYYFYSDSVLWNKYELLEIKAGEEIPPGIRLIILNSGSNTQTLFQCPDWNRNCQPEMWRINFRPVFKSSPDDVLPLNLESFTYSQVLKYLRESVKISDYLAAFEPNQLFNQASASNAKIAWEGQQQKFSLQNLSLHALYRINYSYFPFFRAEKGKTYRGLGERIYFMANAATDMIAYRPYAALREKFCLVITIVTALLFFFYLWRRVIK